MKTCMDQRKICFLGRIPEVEELLDKVLSQKENIKRFKYLAAVTLHDLRYHIFFRQFKNLGFKRKSDYFFL